jgi:2-polyprenyl-3-methyl-5-hydroxy-6-metoxy-1,4-benzoquinol methylase
VLKENIYGHAKRLSWILSRLGKDDRILEFGCGTGSMISIPLACMGYKVVGYDTDPDSIAFGRELCRAAGVDPEILREGPLSLFEGLADVVIASEVFEHIPGENLSGVLSGIREKLKEGGSLLVTVPNGYGWFELESFFWFKAGLGRAIERLRIDRAVRKGKAVLCGPGIAEHYHDTPSTLSSSPHIRRFTFASIRNTLAEEGFAVTEATGSVLFCGPFSNLLFTGVPSLMRVNCVLGGWLKEMASNFYVACRKSDAIR